MSELPTTATPRLLVVPGLHDSGPAHWQSWLQARQRSSVRVQQRDWGTPDLERWSARIGATLERAGPGPWIAAGHSFGCLALAHHLWHRPADSPLPRLRALLLVAPADPDRFGLAESLPPSALPVHSVLVASQTDPWMSAARARQWAERWGSHWVNLGDAGHINAESGFGPLPLAQRWVVAMGQQWVREQRRKPAGFDRLAAAAV